MPRGRREGRRAPGALQIADRWHLLRNASDALRGVLEHHHRDLRAAARMATAPSEPPREISEALQPVAAESERPLRSTERRAQAAQERRDARYAEAVRLRDQGLSTRAVARSLGVERKTLRCWLRAGHAPTWQHADRGTSILNPYHGYLEDRWQAGCRNAAALWRELEERGFPEQYSVVRDWGTRRMRDLADVPRGSEVWVSDNPS